MHLDETTPHIHCLFVPLTADGKLCANDLFKKKDLYELQDQYAEKMFHYGLERGERGSDKVHDNKQVYTGRVLRAEEEIENLTVKGVFGIDKDKTIQNLKNALKINILGLDKAVLDKNKNKRSSELKISMINGTFLAEDDKNIKKVEELERKLKNVHNFINRGFENPKVFEDEKEKRRKSAGNLLEKKAAEERAIAEKLERSKRFRPKI